MKLIILLLLSCPVWAANTPTVTPTATPDYVIGNNIRKGRLVTFIAEIPARPGAKSGVAQGDTGMVSMVDRGGRFCLVWVPRINMNIEVTVDELSKKIQ